MPRKHRRSSSTAKQRDISGSASDPAISSPAKWIIPYFLIPALLVAAVAFCTIKPIADPDCWFHMAFGRYVLQHHQIPKTDVFSYTAVGREWISSGWLSSVFLEFLFEKCDSTGSGAGPILMVFFAVATAVLLIYFVAVRSFRSAGGIALVLLAALLASYMRYLPRPDVWSVFFTAAVTLILVYADGGFPQTGETLEKSVASPHGAKSPPILWALPLVMVLWGNMHAGFLAGVVVICIFGAWQLFLAVQRGRRERLLWLVPCALGAVAWLLNPYGWRILALAQKIKAIPGYRELIFEWMPLVRFKAGFFLPWPTYVGFALVLGTAGWLMGRERRTVQPWRVAALVFFTLFALWQRRQSGLFAFAAPVLILPEIAAAERTFSLAARPARLAVNCSVFAGIICVMQFTGKLESGEGWPVIGRNGRMLPCIATDWYKENRPPGNMYNNYGIGGYLLYFLSPETKVFIDGRLDIYDPRTWADYQAIDEHRMSIENAISKYGLTNFFIYSRDAEDDAEHIAHRLARDPDFRLVFFDDDHAIFARATGESAGYAAAHEFKYVSPFTPDKMLDALKNPALRDAVRTEIQRAREISLGSANANVLAAIASNAMGDVGGAQRFLDDALVRDPQNFLAKHVQLK